MHWNSVRAIAKAKEGTRATLQPPLPTVPLALPTGQDEYSMMLTKVNADSWMASCGGRTVNASISFDHADGFTSPAAQAA
jgi:hypothetical protein